MGQATVDLPDPLENPQTPAPNLSAADDLLAQLAGDEIDRMLAESDTAAPVTPGESDTPGGIESVDVPPVPDTQIDEVFAELQAAEKAKPVEASPTIASSAPDPSVTSHAVARTPHDDSVADAASETPMPTASIAHVVESTPVATEKLDTDAGAAAERAALKTGTIVDPLAGEDATAGLGDVERDLPIILKPLAWLNAPLDLLPDEIRDAMGKIAILTLVNAIAVLAYVMMFRRHH